MKLILISLSCIFLSLSALAQSPTQSSTQSSTDSQSLTVEKVETRAHEIGRLLRCVVCQNQSIDESNAPLALDMRKLVRNRIRAGDSDADVLAFMQNRYGDFVLLKPPVQTNTYLLWFSPIILLLLVPVWYFRRIRLTRRPVEMTPLSADEKKQYGKVAQNIDKPVKDQS